MFISKMEVDGKRKLKRAVSGKQLSEQEKNSPIIFHVNFVVLRLLKTMHIVTLLKTKKKI